MDARFAVGHPNLILEELGNTCRGLKWGFSSRPKRLNGKTEWENVWCTFVTSDYDVRFAVQQMPGCCAVLVIHHVETQDQNVFDATLIAIEHAARNAGFGSLMMAQVIDYVKFEDEPWYLCLKRGWEASKSFLNAKSGNRVIYLTKDLGQTKWRPELEK